MATLIIFFPLATFPWALHHSMIKRILFDVQGQMKKGSRKCALLLCKLKVDDLFGRLLRGPKIGCTAGPLGVVTYHSVTEGFLIYAAFLLFSFNIKSAYP
ncbi:hypothetical protein TYRP_005236 [Tyrophagus putrescentiae]|nr:hypothetical protein TYRP_005236 [Tyrophagus putrescentiae]